ncbi:MAG: CPBP family intramembrane metalloprotease [Eubacteriales bacterium]|nr:CPBP family intramembrane metalloprotease [Eubacteriales bacterium]
MRTWMRSHPAVVGVVGFLIGYAVFRLLPEPNQGMAILKRALVAAMMMAIMAVVGGREAFRWEKGSFLHSVRLYRSMLAVTIVMGLFALVTMAQAAQGVPAAGWGFRIALLAVEFFFVGLFEETCFRGVLMGGLVARLGTTRKGLFAALIFSSLVFGFAHVDSALFGTLTASTVIQMVSKTVTTGGMGLLIGVVYLKTNNIWAASILHGFGDYMLMLGASLYMGEQTSHTYVDPEAGVASALMLMAVMVVLHLWPVIDGLRLTGKLPLPQRGPWKEA